MPPRERPKRDVVAEHEAAIKEFNANGEPAAYCCFIWPHLNRWQCLAAYESHRAHVPKAEEMLREAYRLAGLDASAVDEDALIDNALNSLAEVTLQQQSTPYMGPLLMYVADKKRLKWMVAVSDRGNPQKPGMNGIRLEPVVGVSNLDEMRAYCNSHPLVSIANVRLLAEMMKGAKQ